MSSFRRKTGWQGDLHRYLEECDSKEFVWGEFDCALFAADWVLRMTGQDVAAEYRGTYDTEIGSAKRLLEVHGGDLSDAMRSLLGNPLFASLLARRGDVMLLTAVVPSGQEAPAAGIVDESGVMIAVPSAHSTGLTRYPMDRAILAWAIG